MTRTVLRSNKLRLMDSQRCVRVCSCAFVRVLCVRVCLYDRAPVHANSACPGSRGWSHASTIAQESQNLVARARMQAR
jgi:hypothetical protein